MRLELSGQADADIVGIMEYCAVEFGWDKAETYVQSFDEAFALLVEYPEIGAVHPDVRPPIRSLAHGSHLIFYDVEAVTIIVRRLLHKAMDVGRWLG